MPQTDKRVDKYIDAAADFAKPILKHLRKLVHEACPEVTEVMKWSFPHFDHKGSMCDMAAFKQHCSFGFWKQSLMEDSPLFKANRSKGGMGSFSKITSLSDLPSDDRMIAYIREAARLNDEGIKVPKKPKAAPKPVTVPEDLAAALAGNPKAAASFEKFSPSMKREYIEWITEAKTAPTHEKRLATSVEWIAEGKSRNWKYERKQDRA